MSALETVKKALTDIEKGTIAASTYTDDMTFSGPVPQPLNRDQYVDLMRALVEAIPDWNFHARDFTADGDTVHVAISITGTQTRTLRGLMPGMPDLPPTGKHAALPPERLSITVRGNQISQIVAQVPPDGGVPGLLKQLGVALPA
jgi:predicted ester cyclase